MLFSWSYYINVFGVAWPYNANYYGILNSFVHLHYPGSKHLIEVLLHHGVKPSALTKNQFSALHLATYKVLVLPTYLPQTSLCKGMGNVDVQNTIIV